MITAADIAAPLGALAEGLRLRAYKDPGGVWTVGIGHTGQDVTPNLEISPELAWQLFKEDQDHILKMVSGRPALEAAALADFGFNCGPGALALVLAGKDSIDNPKYAADRRGNVLGGLVARRRLESLLILVSRGEA